MAKPAWDTVASLRALGDIQRRGLEAANDVIARLVGDLDSSDRPAGQGSGAASGDSVADLRGAMLDAWRLLSDGGAPSDEPSARRNGDVWVDPLEAESVTVGGTVTSEFWLHNRSGEDATGIVVHCGELRSESRDTIPVTSIHFEPASVELLPDRSSRGIEVRLDVPESAAPGTYRAIVMAEGLPDVWMPIEVVVEGDPMVHP